MLPVRCYTCGKVLGHLSDAREQYYKKFEEEGKEEDWRPFFEKFHLTRYCCKRVIIAQVHDPNQTRSFQLPPSITICEKKSDNIFIAR